MQLAQLNVGRLIAPVDDPRVADFMSALDVVNGIGKRSPGFVWMMEGSGEPGRGNTEAKLEGDPQFIANLTVWEDAKSLESFVWDTVHRKVYERRAEWFQVLGKMHLVFWWVPDGHRPTLAEAMERLDHLNSHGSSEFAFGWDGLADANKWRSKACGHHAA